MAYQFHSTLLATIAYRFKDDGRFAGLDKRIAFLPADVRGRILQVAAQKALAYPLPMMCVRAGGKQPERIARPDFLSPLAGDVPEAALRSYVREISTKAVAKDPAVAQTCLALRATYTPSLPRAGVDEPSVVFSVEESINWTMKDAGMTSAAMHADSHYANTVFAVRYLVDAAEEAVKQAKKHGESELMIALARASGLKYALPDTWAPPAVEAERAWLVAKFVLQSVLSPMLRLIGDGEAARAFRTSAENATDKASRQRICTSASEMVALIAQNGNAFSKLKGQPRPTVSDAGFATGIERFISSYEALLFAWDFKMDLATALGAFVEDLEIVVMYAEAAGVGGGDLWLDVQSDVIAPSFVLSR
jgi:hypothetical protein